MVPAHASDQRSSKRILICIEIECVSVWTRATRNARSRAFGKGEFMPIFEDDQKRQEIIQLLTAAYWMEIETVMNYISSSVNLDGVRAEEIKKSLAADVTAEIGHAQQFARRIKNLSGITPGSFEFKPSQKSLQPPAATTDVV